MEKIKELIESGKSTREVAKELGISQGKVKYWMEKNGIDAFFKKFNLGGKNLSQHKCRHCGETDKRKFMKLGNARVSFTICKKCHSIYTIKRFQKYKDMAVIYKGGKCENCGYNKCNASLHFHHKDPLGKDPRWSLMKNWKFENVKKEIDKCMLVCANCHGEIHYFKRINNEVN